MTRIQSATSAILLALVALGCEEKTPAPATAPAPSASAASAPPAASPPAPVASPAPAPASAAPSDVLPTNVTYTTYKNATFGYSVDVASIFGSATPFLGAAGQEWKWGDRALMNVAAIEGKGKTIKEWHDDAKKEAGVMGSDVKDNWFFKTGKKGSKIFWQKSILKNDKLFTVRLEYNEDTKSLFDSIVGRVSKTLTVP